MQKRDSPEETNGDNSKGFLATLLQWAIRDTIRLWVPIVFGTGVGAILCLYLGAPLIYSLLGGVLVLAIYVAWDGL